GQAEVEGVAGTWRDLTENVNLMASNLTDQVRNIADVASAVASGDLSQKITVDAKGEILDLKETLNTMVDQLRSFAAEVTRVARADREREPDGNQPDRSGAKHRHGRHGGRLGRPDPEDHGRRARRDPAAEEHAEHHGRPAVVVRRRGHARGARGRYRREAWWP